MSIPAYRKDEIKTIIEANSLNAVIEAIAEIASEKADYIYQNWHYNSSGNDWKGASNMLKDVNSSIKC